MNFELTHHGCSRSRGSKQQARTSRSQVQNGEVEKYKAGLIDDRRRDFWRAYQYAGFTG